MRELAIGFLVPVLALAAPPQRDARFAAPTVTLTQTGGRVRVTATVRNVGETRSGRARVSFRIGGRVRATRSVPRLAPGRAFPATAALPAPRGGYRVLACVDGTCGASAPPPVLVAAPADPTARTDARFAFRHPWRGVRFDCRLDDAPPTRCASPVGYAHLDEGDHRFSVTASRGARRLGATTIHRWTIDTTVPPAPTLSSAPDALSNRREGEFGFTDADADATLLCALDQGPARPCASPHRITGLADGEHRFDVHARDPAGNEGAPRTVRWTVDATPPAVPVIDPEISGTSARFAFTAEPGARLSCRLDEGPAAPCGSPVEYGELTEGEHRFDLIARDAAGNAAENEHRWAVTLHPGASTGPPVTVEPTSATVSGTVTPAGQATTFFVEYRANGADAYARSAVAPAGSTRVEVPVQALLIGLAPATTYEYRVVASTCGGCAAGTTRGEHRTLITPPPNTYTNPVYGGLADPMSLRDLGDFYTYGTGNLFPVLHSTDLVHWTRVGTAMTRRPAWVPQGTNDEWNPWAPSVLRRDGACPGTTSTACYFMYYTGLNTAVNPDANCIGVAISTSPTGPFTDTGILNTDPPLDDGSGRPLGCGDAAGYSNIDAAPFIDPADGKAYLYLSTGHDATTAWHRTISVIPLASDLIHAAGPRQPLFSMTQPWEGDVVEGPWMVHHGGRYYLLYSGGTFTNATYAMGYAYGTSPTGPFVKPSATPILKSTPEVIGPGGGSVVTAPNGTDWLVYHGRAVLGGPRTMRIDPLVWNDAADPPTVAVRGPTTTPQPRP